MPRPPRDADDLLVCADVLGSFGVTAADIRRSDGDDPLEEALATLLSDGRDRTAVLRGTIASSDRGISCSARYPRETLASELRTVFESIGWSIDLEAHEATTPRDRLAVQVTDHRGRRRETTIMYPETPLGSDNLPAILHAIDEASLAATDASFVLLSTGVDRWRAALIDDSELERLRDRYGPRVAAVDRPLLPECGLEAYTSAESAAEPWPAWANSRERDGRQSTLDGVDSLIDEAETGGSETSPIETGGNETSPVETGDSETAATADVGEQSAESDTDGFELRGSPSVSRVRDDDSESAAESTTAPSTESATDTPPASATNSATESTDSRSPNGSTGSERVPSPSGSVDSEQSNSSSDSTTGFGSLSGTTETKRVSNDSFGSDVAWETDDDRYRALGVALGAGGAISVEGLLEDEEFLPELPEVEPNETRIEFENPFDPAAIRDATAAAEESGFVWVDSGSLETTRVSNG